MKVFKAILLSVSKYCTVGMIQNEQEQALSKWGVKSLPWLILKDKNHIVTAEGFGLDELEEKIKDGSEKLEE